MTGREREEKELIAFLNSERAEFLAIFGRRRVGKTFLIRTFFSRKPVVFLNVTGMKNGTMYEQLGHFIKAIGNAFYQGATLALPKNWNQAFDILTQAIKQIPKNKKVVLFLDEFPWMATNKSNLLQNLSFYWNQYWESDSRIKLIICGSSASWIIKKILKDRGGLHNRITRKILLEPLTLV